MKIHKNPRVFEYDETEGIIDIFVRKDPNCPYPFHEDDWYHEGFTVEEFFDALQDLLKENHLEKKAKEEKRYCIGCKKKTIIQRDGNDRLEFCSECWYSYRTPAGLRKK